MKVPISLPGKGKWPMGRRSSDGVVIIGAGGHGKVVCDALVSTGQRILGWVDDDTSLRGGGVNGFPVLGTQADIPDLLKQWGKRRPAFIVAIGDNAQRGALFDQLVAGGMRPANAVHRSAVVSPSARLGRGVMILAGAVVNPDTAISDNVIVNTCASVDHNNLIARDAHLAPGVHTGGNVRIGRAAFLGMGVVVLPDRTIGAETIVGAGAVVHRDLPDAVVAVGVPARVQRALR